MEDDGGSTALTCYTMDYWFASLPVKRDPDSQGPLARGFKPTPPPLKENGQRLKLSARLGWDYSPFFLLKSCCYETLIGPERKKHDQEGTWLCSQVMEEGGMGSPGLWSLRLELLTDFIQKVYTKNMYTNHLRNRTPLPPSCQNFYFPSGNFKSHISSWQHLK